MTTSDDDILSSTTAVIVILTLLCLFPLVIYGVIISGFLCNRELQYELHGGDSNKQLNQKKSSTSSGLLMKKEQPPGMDIDDDTSSEDIVEEVPLVLLSCNNVTYKVKKQNKTILDGVSAWFAPRTLTAILGTSGTFSLQE